MPTLTANTRCYIAWRRHAELGLLVKIGSSQDPARRVASLGAKLLGVLPYRCERNLHDLLSDHRAWPHWWRPGDAPQRRFTASTEWYTATPEVVEALLEYVKELR